MLKCIQLLWCNDVTRVLLVQRASDSSSSEASPSAAPWGLARGGRGLEESTDVRLGSILPGTAAAAAIAARGLRAAEALCAAEVRELLF